MEIFYFSVMQSDSILSIVIHVFVGVFDSFLVLENHQGDEIIRENYCNGNYGFFLLFSYIGWQSTWNHLKCNDNTFLCSVFHFKQKENNSRYHISIEFQLFGFFISEFFFSKIITHCMQLSSLIDKQARSAFCVSVDYIVI